MIDKMQVMNGFYSLYNEAYDNSTSLVQMLASYPQDPMFPGRIAQTDALFVWLDSMVHWTAYLIACSAVTISLLICMAIILLSCACIFEMVAEGAESAWGYLRRKRENREMKNF